MGYNNLTGHVSPTIFNISRLEFISLTNNSLLGSLPIDICSYGDPALEELDFSYNSFDGGIPSSLSQCSQLRKLLLHSNNFTGVVPREIGNMTRLVELSLDSNSLSGKLKSLLTLLRCEIENLMQFIAFQVLSH